MTGLLWRSRRKALPSMVTICKSSEAHKITHTYKVIRCDMLITTPSVPRKQDVLGLDSVFAEHVVVVVRLRTQTRLPLVLIDSAAGPTTHINRVRRMRMLAARPLRCPHRLHSPSLIAYTLTARFISTCTLTHARRSHTHTPLFLAVWL